MSIQIGRSAKHLLANDRLVLSNERLWPCQREHINAKIMKQVLMFQTASQKPNLTNNSILDTCIT